MSDSTNSKQTKLVASGRAHSSDPHPVSLAPQRSSTILFPTFEDFRAKEKKYIYGRLGTKSHEALCETIGHLEQCEFVELSSSGLAAISNTLLTFAKPGGHMLVTDSAYDPVRGFCDRLLTQLGIKTEYYDPRIGKDIAALIKENTCAILAETPGSLTFEVQDIPALSAVAKASDIPLIVDNTWAAGYYFSALKFPNTISVISATKYLAGHADCLMGSISTNNPEFWQKIRSVQRQLGVNVSADDIYQVQKGMRTLAARLPVHQNNGLELARWFDQRPEVQSVLHPAMVSHPDHALWERDFTGSTGLFGVILRPCSHEQLSVFCNSMSLFGMGYSWGGFESLLIPAWPAPDRTAVPWTEDGQLLRVHAGLEDPHDLIRDLERAFEAFHEVG